MSPWLCFANKFIICIIEFQIDSTDTCAKYFRYNNFIYHFLWIRARALSLVMNHSEANTSNLRETEVYACKSEVYVCVLTIFEIIGCVSYIEFIFENVKSFVLDFFFFLLSYIITETLQTFRLTIFTCCQTSKHPHQLTHRHLNSGCTVVYGKCQFFSHWNEVYEFQKRATCFQRNYFHCTFSLV